MNGFSKIEKWLKNQGYTSKHIAYDAYRHSDSFHKRELYYMDVYRISNGLYILVKASGRPRYFLSRTTNPHNLILLDFSQECFIKRLSETAFFPKMEGH